MRARTALVPVLACALAAALASTACTTRLDVTTDEREAIARLRTWDWLPSGYAPRPGVDAPLRDAAVLHAQLGRLIATTLDAQGYPRSRRADAFVIYHLVLTPRRVAVRVPRAPYLLSSMNHTASWWIEGSDEEIRIYEDFRLVIALVDREDVLLWRGVFEQQVSEGMDLSLGEAVGRLLRRLPARVVETEEGDAPREAPPSPQTAPSEVG